MLARRHLGRSILPQKWEESGRYLSKLQLEALKVWFCRDLGLGRKCAESLVSKPTIYIRRIEEFISGLIDCLWLTDPTIFIVGSEDYKTIRTLVRKVFRVGSSNLSVLIKDWKEWTNWFTHQVCESVLLDEALLHHGNLFHRLSKIRIINDVLTQKVSVLIQGTVVAHMTSTRQMPYMGRQTEVKAVADFKEIITTPFTVDPEHENLMVRSAARIGRLCRNLRNGIGISDRSSHFSATSSGEINHSLGKGGQAAALKDAIAKWLLPEQTESYLEDTPFGIAEHREGVPLWKTLFVEADHQLELMFSDFGDKLDWIKDVPERVYGLGSYTGRQIMYIAWKEIEVLPLIRASTVPELGNKARIVTLSKFWLNVLQAPLSHVMKEVLKYHPSCFASFTRGDQAWSATNRLSRLNPRSISGFAVLSSDLKNATNAQVISLTKRMIKAFTSESGLVGSDSYVNLVLDTICPRLVEIDHETIVSCRGIMMGEAIAKPSLTLLNLAVEELAFLQYENKLILLNTNKAAPLRRWRCYSIGGDDHLAIGPDRYLNLITDNHVKSGSIISPDKHALSRKMVKYCERVIIVANLQYNLNRSNHELDKSLIVDSIKVRLLEKGQSTLLSKDNKNVAIGKAQQLVKTLDWLPKQQYTKDYIRSVQNLFIKRMGSLLPNRNNDEEAFHSICLPKILGGYGLGLQDDLIDHLSKSKPAIQKTVSAALLGVDTKIARRVLSRLNTTISDRSIQGTKWYEDEMTSQFRDYPEMIGAINGTEMRKRFPGSSYQESKAHAESAGWLSIDQFARRVTRGHLFGELLSKGAEKKNVFQTRNWIQEYSRLESRLNQEVDIYPIPDYEDLTVRKLRNVLGDMTNDLFIDSRQITSFDKGVTEDDFDFFDGELLAVYEDHQPTLVVGLQFVGLDSSLNAFTRRVRQRTK
uniref:RNA-dependent RNA polymerase n=1 Tax=Bremia lactucae associated narnavirus 1 TaxID=2719802 RepID=A0A6G9EM76_9VIRU|nr:MAG: RNA-dependent RNA polymerase [Bremia lactucae associated narnavirus 1]